jgi:hypothetical protein
MSDINLNIFEHSDFNTLLNNVSSSLYSNIYRKINPDNNSILELVELQDSNYDKQSYIRPRYEGSKTTSLKYNVYTSESVLFKNGIDVINWAGDTSFGKTAAVDYNVEKFAFSNNVVKTSLNFYDKTIINIRFLIDETGSLVELNNSNRNIFEVQSMFKKGDIVTVSLMDKYNPSNQNTLDGDKVVFEGGFAYNPIIYREASENLVFTYLEPKETVESKLGTRIVNTSGYLWRTVGDLNQEFTSPPNNITIISTVNGTPTTNQFSFTKTVSTAWPYGRMPLSAYQVGRYKDYLNQYRNIGSHDTEADDPSFYTIDWFIPNGTDTAQGGYLSNNMTGKVNTVTSPPNQYTYVEAPVSSTYAINIDVPFKIKNTNRETGGERGNEKGPSIVKVIGVLEVQRSGTSTWDYLDTTDVSNIKPFGYTKIKATNIPIATGGRQATGTTRALVDEENSFLYFPEDTVGGTVGTRYISPYFEIRCQLLNHKVALKQGDKIRVKFYFAEVTTFFRRSENIYFEIPIGDNSQTYFEVYDAVNSQITLQETETITSDIPLFTLDSDNKTLVFSTAASLLYNKAIFEPQNLDNPQSVGNLYTFVENIFKFEEYDVVRFTPFYSIDPEYFYILEVIEPDIVLINGVESVVSPLKITFNKEFLPGTISTSYFAFFRKSPDETSVIINFRKKDGQTSNAYLLPFNLKDSIRKDIGNITGPLKDTILAKVLLVG